MTRTRLLTIDELVERERRRDRLVALVIACVVALALVGLAHTGPGDAAAAGPPPADIHTTAEET